MIGQDPETGIKCIYEINFYTPILGISTLTKLFQDKTPEIISTVLKAQKLISNLLPQIGISALTKSISDKAQKLISNLLNLR